jgi:hypothetical protein
MIMRSRLKGRQVRGEPILAPSAYLAEPGANAVAPSFLNGYQGLRSFHSLDPWLFSCHACGVRSAENSN